MTGSYPIKIWSGLLSNGHTQKIENALWEFIWLVNKVTKEEEGIGYVLKGIPIKVDDICKDLKRNYQSVYRHLQQLKKNGYIDIKKAPYGLIITVNNSKKFIKNNKAGLIKNDKAEIESFIINDTCLIKNNNGLIKNDKANKILKDIKDNKDIYIVLFEYWNNKNIITHKKLSAKATSLIKSKFDEGYTEDEIKKAIHNYSVVLNSEDYYFKYRWTLEEFFQRGFEKFKDAEVAMNNYLKNHNNKQRE
ncbi:MAG: hypothetical protein ACYDIA_13835 [Candidatus Humimicrobiaceae bacterium]